MNKIGVFIWMVLLTALAGFINAVAIKYFSTTVSHVTGLISNIAISLMNGDWKSWLLLSLVVISFLVGAIVSGFVAGERIFYLHRRYGVMVIVIGVLLALSTLLLKDEQAVFVCALSLLMGMQNGMVVSFRGILVRMTHMTGNITDLGVFIGYKLRHKINERWAIGMVPAFAILGFVVGGLIGLGFSSIIDSYAFYIAAGCYVILGVVYLSVYKYATDKNFNDIPDELEEKEQ